MGPADPNQFSLLGERRFLPFFVTQAFGAFNDNLLKNVLIILVTYQATRWTTARPDILANIAGGLFIAPFVIFSGLAGQLAERLDKALVLKCVKALEVAIMLVAAAGFLQHRLPLLLFALFMMGVHSTFFAPAKYGLLPQVLGARELIGGNAMLESGTFLAILLGTLAAGVLGGHGNTAWIAGALVLVQLPLYCHNVLRGSESIVTLTLAVFSIGVGLGSLLCERLSGGQVEIGLVPFGSIGLTLFAVDWVVATPHTAAPAVLTVAGLLHSPGGMRSLADIAAIGVFGGFFIVPLNALVQQRSRPEALSRVIGANSVLNALFMVAAAALGAIGLARGLSVMQLILVAALMNAAVAAYIYTLVPEFLLRFVCWLLVHTLYRLHRHGARHFPEAGAALIVCNHVSFVDALIISAACRRPIHFIMDEAIFRAPIIRTLASGMKAIPIASAKEDPTVLEHAFQLTAAALQNGDLVCIFPEGRLTRDGTIQAFRPGLMRILAQTPVPVIPIAITGLWGSMFSRRATRIWQRLPRKLWARIVVNVGAPVAPEEATPEQLREDVCALYEGALRDTGGSSPSHK